MRGPTGTIVGAIVFIVATALLTSVGGLGIVASPVTVALLLFVVGAHPSLPFIVTGTAIGALTGLEGGWGIGYLAFGQFSGWTVLPMVLGGVLGGAGVLALGVRSRRRFLSQGFAGEPVLARVTSVARSSSG
jgi:hypothetical protein